ncbi:MAG: prenyltransferase, partial [Candidatus Marinimicrobia bacterium]|nr:prenyltransferase [Candidatus Neomarinimicrobiota bacterium]
GLDMYFFTFNPTRKAVQINFNPKVQCVVRPDGEDGIKELQIDGYATKIIDQSEKEKAREAVLKVTEAFSEYMHDDFLIANDVVGYYKIKPTVIKYVDFFADTQFEWMEIPENKPSIPSELLGGLRRSIQRWMTIVRAPFLTATIAPILLGSAIAYKQFGTFDWSIFWLVLLGAIFAQCGTNTINDYFDHKSRTDELNKLASPFNGGSRAIQSGLMTPANMLLVSVLFFGSTIGIGLELNNLLFGDYFAISVLMYLGLIGVFLGVMYTGFLKLAYNGLGDLAVFIGFGPLMVYGAAYMQNQSVDPLTTLLFSIPVGIFIALVLFINCFQDYNADKAANKNSWVVRLAGPGDKANYRAPFKVWKNLMMLSFMIILGASLYAGNLFTLIALFPLFIFNFASKKGNSWLDQWEKEDANLQQLPYELLIVNVSTIGIHFLTGILLTLGILISTWI